MTTDVTVLHVLAQQIARALRSEQLVGFNVETPEQGERHYVTLRHDDGRAFSINSTWNGNGKLHVSGNYPKRDDSYAGPREWGVIGYNETAPTINVSASRKPSAIAADIARRFLPLYTELYRACVAKQQEQTAYRALVNGTAAQLAALIPGADLREHNGTQSVHWYTTTAGYGDATAYSDSVNMDLRALPLLLAREIAQLIGKRIALTCECSDKGCSAHAGVSKCSQPAATTLFRVDMEDRTGVAFCEACAADAIESGVFATREG